MRILHVTNWLPGCHHISGGAEAVCLNTIEMARAAGHECEVFCLPLDFPSPHPFAVHGADTVLCHLPRRLHNPVDFIKTLWHPQDGFVHRALASRLRSWRPEVVHFHKFDRLSYSLVGLARRQGCATLWSVYDYLAVCPESHLQQRSGGYCTNGQGERCYECYHPGRRLPRLQQRAYVHRRNLVLGSLRQLDQIIVLSSRCREIMAQHGLPEERIKVIHQSYPVAETAPAPAAEVDPHLVFFAGWLAPAKGLHVLLEAMPLVRQEFPEVQLIALGLPAPDPQYPFHIQELMSQHNLSDWVDLRGRLPREEFLQALRRAAVVVVPEQWENMSPVILVEAMAHGRPVVASRLGGIPEFVTEGETGYLAAAERPEEFAAGIKAVLGEPAQAMALGRRAHQRARELFDRSVVGQELLETYEACVRARQEAGVAHP